MKVNLGVELSDEQRQALASVIAGKAVKRRASRNDVRAALDGFLAGLACPEDSVAAPANGNAAGVVGARAGYESRTPYSASEQAIAKRLADEGRSSEYIRGFIGAGRVLAKSGHKPRVCA